MMGRRWCIIQLVVCIFTQVHCSGLVEVFGWKQIEYELGDGTHSKNLPDFLFPTEIKHLISSYAHKATPVSQNQTDNYIPYNNVPMGVNHYKDKLFITMPRRRLGIPSTLNYIDLKTVGSDHSPKLRPFPDLETNSLMPGWAPNPERIISVYRSRIDACDRFWFVDTGLMELPGNRTQIQRPSIWTVDLKTNQRLHRFEMPESVVSGGSGLASITVDVNPGACDEAYAYIPDLNKNALYIFSLKKNHIWVFQHNFFHFEPTGGHLSIAGQNFTWNDGIFSITLGDKQSDGFNTAYFHPMASTNEFTVSTKILQSESNARRSYHGDDFQLLGTRGPFKQSTMHDFDPKTGIILYAEIMQNGVGCWNTRKSEFSQDNHGQVASDSTKMIYPSDLTIDRDGDVWVMTNSMPLFIYSQLDINAINFRVWKGAVKDVTANTVCEVPK